MNPEAVPVFGGLTARQVLQGFAQLAALLQDVVELVKVAALWTSLPVPVPAGALDGARHWKQMTDQNRGPLDIFYWFVIKGFKWVEGEMPDSITPH